MPEPNMPSDHTTTQLAVLDMAGTTIADNGVVQPSIDATFRRCGLAPVSPAELRPLRGMA
jgi:phosphoglycolate phosphatase